MLVGLPLSLDGGDSAQTRETREFAARLAGVLEGGVPVELYDERFTTRLAQRSAAGAGAARTSEDSRAAAHLLESWLAARAAGAGEPPARTPGTRVRVHILARGDRPSHERTSEEREQARVERNAGVRSAKAGRRPLRARRPDDPIAEPTPVEPEPVAGSPVDAHPEPGGPTLNLSRREQVALEPARLRLRRRWSTKPRLSPRRRWSPLQRLRSRTSPPSRWSTEPGPTLEHEAAADPGSAPEPELAPAPEAEHVDPASVPLAADPLEEELPIAPPEPADPPLLPPEPVIVAAVLPEEEGHAPLDPVEPTEVPVVLPEDTVGEEEAPGYPIPGLPADQGRPPREPLPEAPPRVRRSERPPMRRAFRRADDGAAAGAESVGLAGGGRSSRERRMTGRWIAVLALIAIGVVVAVLIYGLTRSSSHKTPAGAAGRQGPDPRGQDAASDRPDRLRRGSERQLPRRRTQLAAA